MTGFQYSIRDAGLSATTAFILPAFFTFNTLLEMLVVVLMEAGPAEEEETFNTLLEMRRALPCQDKLGQNRSFNTLLEMHRKRVGPPPGREPHAFQYSIRDAAIERLLRIKCATSLLSILY